MQDPEITRHLDEARQNLHSVEHLIHSSAFLNIQAIDPEFHRTFIAISKSVGHLQRAIQKIVAEIDAQP